MGAPAAAADDPSPLDDDDDDEVAIVVAFRSKSAATNATSSRGEGNDDCQRCTACSRARAATEPARLEDEAAGDGEAIGVGWERFGGPFVKG